MASAIATLADAVVAELNGEDWDVAFVAQRAYRPRFEPKDLQTPHVTVVRAG